MDSNKAPAGRKPIEKHELLRLVQSSLRLSNYTLQALAEPGEISLILDHDWNGGTRKTAVVVEHQTLS